jgi:hypothetical protein
MKRRFFRLLLRLVPDTNKWYNLRESISRVQANCPKCKSWYTAVGNDRCSDCVMYEALGDKFVGGKWVKAKEYDGRLA